MVNENYSARLIDSGSTINNSQNLIGRLTAPFQNPVLEGAFGYKKPMMEDNKEVGRVYMIGNVEIKAYGDGRESLVVVDADGAGQIRVLRFLRNSFGVILEKKAGKVA